MTIRSLPRNARQWTLDHLSIRLRLTLWYAALLTVTLTLFSLAVFTSAQNQLESSVRQNLTSRAQLIANTLQTTLQGELSNPQGTPVPTATPTPSPEPTHATATASPGTGTGTATAGPVPTVNPEQNQKISRQLNLHGIVPDLLGQIDLGFEVLDAKGAADYYAPNVSNTGLPLNQDVIYAALHEGVCDFYTQSQRHSQLQLYVQPIVLPQVTASGTGHTAVSANSTCMTPQTHVQIVGAVIVAKPLDDMNASLNTLSHLLAIGVLLAVVFTSMGSWLIAGNGLHPIARMTRTARAIAVNAHAAGLGRRVDYRGPRDEVGELASTFDDMLGSIERVASAQRRFVADASHELRAPLTTIRGSLEFLRRARDLPEEERDAVLDDAYTEAERMTSLVNDLLLLARADAAASSAPGSQEARLDDQMRGRREAVELDQLALDIFRHGRAQLQARHRSALQLTIDGLEPVAAMADPGQLRQVLLILLDNAIKYTPAGGKIRLAVSRQGSRGAICISDTGIGIEPEVQPHIFERFYRGDQARDRDQHGSGLGLAIAKWIIEAHNGEITVQSQPGKGSTFTVLLPAMRRSGEQTSAKVPAIGRRQSRSVVAGAMSPLARLAETVSRPKDVRTLPRKLLRDSTAARDGKAGQSATKQSTTKQSEAKTQRTRQRRPSAGPSREP